MANLFALADAERTEPMVTAFNRDVVAACVSPVCAKAATDVGSQRTLVPGVGRPGLLVRAIGDRLSGQRRQLRVAGHTLVIQGIAFAVDDGPAR